MKMFLNFVAEGGLLLAEGAVGVGVVVMRGWILYVINDGIA